MDDSGMLVAAEAFALFSLGTMALVVASFWALFTKAGRPGWAALVPIYNTVVMLEIAGRPAWWLLLLLIPFVNFVVLLVVFTDLARSFGEGPGVGIGLAFLPIVFAPMLGFGPARYVGPAAV